MTIRNLEYFFRPRSVAVVGASNRAQSVGALVLENIVKAPFPGDVIPINPHHRKLLGLSVVRDVSELEAAPELAVICTPPQTLPGIIGALGERGTKAAVVITGGVQGARTPDGKELRTALLEAARPHLLRILGPNCLGLLVPKAGLNATFAHTNALPGKLAFVTQSGALATAVLDWGKSKGIGFSCFISIGDSADVDFGDLLDYLANDAETSAILLYIESVSSARKFMSAARAAARAKPVIAVKAGRAAEGARAAASHTGALAGVDAVYDAALRRAGILRVTTLQDLFDAAETLARAKPSAGRRLCIVTNGGGAGVLATDALMIEGGELAQLAPATLAQLDKLLPPNWSRANPIDLIGDAPVERYVAALKVLTQCAAADAVLLIHAPTAIVPSAQIAQACVPVLQASAKTVLTCWLGEDAVRAARGICAAAGIPTYETPEEAVRAFLQLADFRRNQDMLIETPAALAQDFSADAEGARRIIAAAIAEKRAMLTEPEAKALLACYGIPTVTTRSAPAPEDAAAIAAQLGFPVALKILSPDITHKSDVGGVTLGLDTELEVIAAARAMLTRVAARAPEARLEGFSVQPMINRQSAHELIVGCSTDAVFGPVLMFGQGGVAVEVVRDQEFALPPLNLALARHMVERTRVVKLLGGFRDQPAANLPEILLTLVRVSQLVCDLPEVHELDINPLFADAGGVLALDARVRLVPVTDANASRLAIQPYPQQLEETIELNGAALLLRPIRPEDEPRHAQFLAQLTTEDTYFRFFHVLRQLPHAQLARFTQIDYDREMAFVATRPNASGGTEILGVVRAVTDPDNLKAEFAIVVRSDLKGQGLGGALMEKIIRYCRARGTGTLIGHVLAGNQRMLALAKRLGFSQRHEDGAVVVSLALNGLAL